MLTQSRAASGRADARSGRQILLLGIPADEAEKIELLFDLMGWAVAAEPPEHAGAQPSALRAAASRPPRLSMRCNGNIIEVACDDRRVLATLSAAGLDRLVMPVPLPALEQLMVFAG